MARCCRLLIDEAGPGAWNMAVDEAILHSAVESPSADPTLRWYRWSEPTLSLGYFQRADEVPDPLAHLPIVRRLSGGGAILHDREWTYSLVFPRGTWPSRAHLDAVLQWHRWITESLGADPPMTLHQGVEASPDPEPFLCFERRSRGDLVIGAHKVVGSAQRSKQGALLQHGSILLDRSEATPHLPGLKHLGADVPFDPLVTALADRMRSDWGFEVNVGALTDQETEAARSLVETKYGHSGWNKRR